MHQQYFCYSILLLLVYAVVQASAGSEDPKITYTCDTKKAITHIAVPNGFDHVKVLKKNNGYCTPVQKTSVGLLQCIKEFKENNKSDDIVKVVTILYEDETNAKIVGGENTKYYTLLCEEGVINKTAKLSPDIDVKTPPPVTIKANITAQPTLSIENRPDPILVGKSIKLKMQVQGPYKLLPQTCNAYRHEGDTDKYQFWERCKVIDTAIISTSMWKNTSTDHSTLVIDMFAFRFIDTGSLIIKCSTTICSSADTVNCDMTCSNVIGRKRRDATILNRKTIIKTATASIALDVFERRQVPENGSQVLCPAWYIHIIGFGMLFWIASKKC